MNKYFSDVEHHINKFAIENAEYIKLLIHNLSGGEKYKKTDYSNRHKLDGTCYFISIFYYWLINGHKGKFGDLEVYYNKIEGIGNHTYCYNKKTDKYIDLTFNQVPLEFRNNDFYSNGKRQRLMTRRSCVDNAGNLIQFNFQVPAKYLYDIMKKYKIDGGNIDNFRFWINNFNK